MGTWEMEKEGAKTRATNPVSMDMHTALGSLNLPLLLFPCRTQSHPLRPDNHRQHPDAVRGSRVPGGCRCCCCGGHPRARDTDRSM